MFGDYDSDDDFVLPKATTPKVPKVKKKKTKTKRKDEETSRKALTSSQVETPSKDQFLASLALIPNGRIVARSGRSARLTAEEKRFQQELQEALRLSEGECQSSSGEIVPPNNSNTHSKEEATAEDMMTNKRKGEEMDDVADSKKVRSVKKKEVLTIDSSSEDEEEGKEEVEEDYHPDPGSVKKSNLLAKKTKKNVFISSDEDEKKIEEKVKPKKKSPPKKKKEKATVISNGEESCEEEEVLENNKEFQPSPRQPSTISKAPLRDRNRRSSGEATSTVKLIVTPKKQDPAPVPTSTPALSSTLSKMLGKLSTIKPNSASVTTPVTPVTPVQRKFPSWKPPAKMGSPGGAAGPHSSPAIGLRLGLSRKFKSKPLHASVKDNN